MAVDQNQILSSPLASSGSRQSKSSFWLLIFLASGFFIYRWLTFIERPGVLGEGWRGYIDQGGYYQEALRLSHFQRIPEVEFGFGPGYPAMGVPFIRIGSDGWPLGDPFFTFNLFAWLLAIAATYLVARRLMGEFLALACGLLVAFATPLMDTVVLPWSTTVSLAAIMLVALIALIPRLGFIHGGLMGFAAGITLSARYVDGLWIIIPVIGVLLARRALSWRALASWGVLVGSLLAIVPTLVLHRLAFGTPFTTPYSHLNSAGLKSFKLSNIVPHALQSFVSPFHFGEVTDLTPLLARMFLIVLAPVGVYVLMFRINSQQRILVAGFVLSSILATVTYWSYWFTGTYGLKFGSIHFFKMWWPLLVVASVYPFHYFSAARGLTSRE